MSRTPMRVLGTLPMPPESVVPPNTTEAMAISVSPLPTAGRLLRSLMA